MSSERLRSARIVLLRTTHLPFVGAIWLYERLVMAHKQEGNHLSFSGPQTPTTPKRLSRLPINSPRLLMADAQAPVGTPTRARPTSRPHARAESSESDAQLRTLVVKLIAQVEELTDMVSQLKREASSAA